MSPVISSLVSDPVLLQNVRTAVDRNGWRLSESLDRSAAAVVSDLSSAAVLADLVAFRERRPGAPVLLYVPNRTEPESYVNQALADGVGSALLIARSAASDVRRLRGRLRELLSAGMIDDVVSAVVTRLGITSEQLIPVVRAAAEELFRNWGEGGKVAGIARALGVTPRQVERVCGRFPGGITPRLLADITLLEGVRVHGAHLGIDKHRAAVDLGLSHRRLLGAAKRTGGFS